jgi:glycosyltransferase involved in cell wall biosynthesis
VIPVLVNGGTARTLVLFRGHLLRAIREAGGCPLTAAGDMDPEAEAELRALGVVRHQVLRLRRTDMNPLADLRYLADLVALLRRERPRVVLNFTHKPVVFGSLAARYCRVPCICSLITGLGYAFIAGDGWRRRAASCSLRMLYRLSLNGRSRMIFQNPDDLADFRRFRLIHAGARTQVVNGSGVDLEHFECSEPSVRPLRFVLIARLLRDKGIGEYIRAAERLADAVPGVEFHLAGPVDPNPVGFSATAVSEWQTRGVIRYHGALADVRPLLRQSSVFVLPSYREGTPRTVLEAMSMGRAIITTDAPGCRETVAPVPGAPAEGRGVRTGDNGFLVPPRDADALAVAMNLFVRHPERAVTMGRRSRRLAEERYNVHAVNRVMLEAMGLVDGASGPGAAGVAVSAENEAHLEFPI